MKTPGSKTRKLKRQKQPNAARAGGSAQSVLTKKLADFRRELDESLLRQAAIAEVLRVISSSPADAQPVFEAIVAKSLPIVPGGLRLNFCSKSSR